MKPMIYQRKGTREVLAHGKIGDYGYVILNLGVHPTAYVSLPEDDPRYFKGSCEIEDAIQDCIHGGVTYAEDHVYGDESYTPENGWWIGWDYAHCGDFSGYYSETEFLGTHTKKWGTDEIYSEVIQVIKKLEETRKAYEADDDDYVQLVREMRYCSNTDSDDCKGCPCEKDTCDWHDKMSEAADAIEELKKNWTYCSDILNLAIRVSGLSMTALVQLYETEKKEEADE